MITPTAKGMGLSPPGADASRRVSSGGLGVHSSPSITLHQSPKSVLEGELESAMHTSRPVQHAGT